MTATITPIRVAVCPETPDGIGYEVKRVMPNWASAQIAEFVLNEVNPADLVPPADLPPMPPNCDGLPVIDFRAADAILALHEERDEP